jgi:hypothetical protein
MCGNPNKGHVPVKTFHDDGADPYNSGGTEHEALAHDRASANVAALAKPYVATNARARRDMTPRAHRHMVLDYSSRVNDRPSSHCRTGLDHATGHELHCRFERGERRDDRRRMRDAAKSPAARLQMFLNTAP